MTDLLKEMQNLGLIGAATADTKTVVPHAGSTIDRSDLAFSGYGEFTPITIGSSTVFENANLERSES